MLYLTCTIISSEDLAHYGVSRIKDWISGDCGTRRVIPLNRLIIALDMHRTEIIFIKVNSIEGEI